MRDSVIIDLYNTNKARILNTMISVCSQWCIMKHADRAE